MIAHPAIEALAEILRAMEQMKTPIFAESSTKAQQMMTQTEQLEAIHAVLNEYNGEDILKRIREVLYGVPPEVAPAEYTPEAEIAHLKHSLDYANKRAARFHAYVKSENGQDRSL